MRKVVAEFDTREKAGLVTYGDSGCLIRFLNDVHLFLRHEYYDQYSYEQLCLFARVPEAGAQIVISIFLGGNSNQDFHDKIKFYNEHRCDFRLPAGQKFDDTFLKPEAYGFLEHEVFRVQDGKSRKRVVHAFKGRYRSIILTYSIDSNNFLSSSFFAAVKNGLQLSDTEIQEPFRIYHVTE